ncbi:MAG: ribonuclease III [Flavobacteriaceae bacterium]
MKLIQYIRDSRMATSGIFFTQLRKKLGIKTSNKALYKKAFTHSSVNLKDSKGNLINFERLEFLGDALLGTIVAESLFQNYPDAKEGTLTKLRAKIVSRSQLNHIGKEMGLIELASISNNHKNFGENIHGNLLESLIGALFIDKGYIRTKSYVLEKIIGPHVDLDNLNDLILSYKGLLIEWTQKEKRSIEFKTASDEGLDPKINYYCQLFIDQKFIVKARALSKKKAEEKAAKKAYHALKLKELAQNDLNE